MAQINAAFVWFQSLVSRVDTCPVTPQTVTARHEPSRLNAGVLTRVRLDQVRLRYPDNRPSAPRLQWYPCFWSDPSALAAALEVLTDPIRDPVYWVMGAYEGGWTISSPRRPAVESRVTELDTLAARGLLPADVAAKLRGQRLSKVPLIFRTESSDAILLPYDQGYGHSIGVRIAIFARAEEPIAAYEAWLAAVRSEEPYQPPLFTTDDRLAPEGCRAWIAPYGVEDREQALVAVTDRSVEDTARSMAHVLNIPFAAVHVTTAEWIAWEAERVPPLEMRQVLGPPSADIHGF